MKKQTGKLTFAYMLTVGAVMGLGGCELTDPASGLSVRSFRSDLRRSWLAGVRAGHRTLRSYYYRYRFRYYSRRLYGET